MAQKWSSGEMFASGKRLQTSGEIVNATRGGMLFDGRVDMKSEGKSSFPFLLAFARGRVLTLGNNQSARSL
jgi:hypothetical protein